MFVCFFFSFFAQERTDENFYPVLPCSESPLWETGLTDGIYTQPHLQSAGRIPPLSWHEGKLGHRPLSSKCPCPSSLMSPPLTARFQLTSCPAALLTDSPHVCEQRRGTNDPSKQLVMSPATAFPSHQRGLVSRKSLQEDEGLAGMKTCSNL